MSDRGHVKGIEEYLLLAIAEVVFPVGTVGDSGCLSLCHGFCFATLLWCNCQVKVAGNSVVIFPDDAYMLHYKSLCILIYETSTMLELS